jgi:hypothetical protein
VAVNSSTTSNDGRWDRAAIRAGGMVALVFAVPFSVAARVIAGDETPEGGKATLVVLLSLCAAIGFLLGAGVSAWHQQRGTPLSHGIVTAAISYVVPQAILIILKIARGGEVRWTGVIFNLTIMITMGVLGGLLGSSMRKHGARPSGQR